MGCTGESGTEVKTATPQSDITPPTFNIQYANGHAVGAKNIAELQEIVPFHIVLPDNEDLPLDLKLSIVSVHLPPDIISEDSRDLWVKVLLTLRKENRTAAVQITESLVGPDMDQPEFRTLQQNDTIVKVAGNQERSHIGAGWDACGIGFFMMGGPSEAMTDENLLSIVEATLKACE